MIDVSVLLHLAALSSPIVLAWAMRRIRRTRRTVEVILSCRGDACSELLPEAASQIDDRLSEAGLFPVYGGVRGRYQLRLSLIQVKPDRVRVRTNLLRQTTRLGRFQADVAFPPGDFTVLDTYLDETLRRVLEEIRSDLSVTGV
jgi:hypothetical protein